jgi:hypothetical protein
MFKTSVQTQHKTAIKKSHMKHKATVGRKLVQYLLQRDTLRTDGRRKPGGTWREECGWGKTGRNMAGGGGKKMRRNMAGGGGEEHGWRRWEEDEEEHGWRR